MGIEDEYSVRFDDATREHNCCMCGNKLRPQHWKMILQRIDGYAIHVKVIKNYCDNCLNGKVEKKESLELNPRYWEK